MEEEVLELEVLAILSSEPRTFGRSELRFGGNDVMLSEEVLEFEVSATLSSESRAFMGVADEGRGAFVLADVLGRAARGDGVEKQVGGFAEHRVAGGL